MKNLFGFLMEGKNVRPLPEPDGREFIVKRAGEGAKLRLAEMDREDDNVQRAANFPKSLTNVFWVMLLCGVFLLGIALELLSGEDGITYEFAVSCGFWWFIGFGAGLTILAAVFFAIQAFHRKDVMSSTAVKEHEGRYERVRREVLDDMLVPSDAVPVDVFSCLYTVKNGKQKGALLGNPLVNLRVYAFRDGEALCLADPTYVVRIPYDNIASLTRICRRRSFVGWNKKEQYNKGAFKPYKINRNSSGQMSVKFCYRVEIRGSETFELLIPPYEFGTLSPMLGYKAQSVIDVKN